MPATGERAVPGSPSAMRPGADRLLRLVVLAGAASAIAFFTLGPVDASLSLTESNCCLLTDVVLNVLLFLPLGIGLSLVGTGRLAATGIGLLTSSAIEVAQRWVPGRTSSLRDVVTNLLGTLIGALLVAGWSSRKQWWRTVGPALAGLLVLGSVGGGFLVEPAIPSPVLWYGFAHHARGSPSFQGQVLSLTLQGIPIPDGPIPESARLSVLLAGSDTVRLSTTVISGPPVSGRAELVGIVAGAPGTEYLSLWQEGRALLAFTRLRLADAGLRPTLLRIDNALPDAAGHTVALSATITRRHLVLAISGIASEATFDFSTALFWASFLPFDFQARPGLQLWPLGLMALTFAGLGMGIRNRPMLVLAALVALFAGPLLAGTAPPSGGALAASAIGLWGGRSLAFGLRLIE